MRSGIPAGAELAAGAGAGAGAASTYWGKHPPAPAGEVGASAAAAGVYLDYISAISRPPPARAGGAGAAAAAGSSAAGRRGAAGVEQRE